MDRKVHEIEKVEAIIEEVEASFKFIALGLKCLKEQPAVVSNNHVTLQLLKSGFERILKIMLLIKEKHLPIKFHNFKNQKSDLIVIWESNFYYVRNLKNSDCSKGIYRKSIRIHPIQYLKLN